MTKPRNCPFCGHKTEAWAFDSIGDMPVAFGCVCSNENCPVHPEMTYKGRLKDGFVFNEDLLKDEAAKEWNKRKR